jgi:hypothetical protein
MIADFSVWVIKRGWDRKSPVILIRVVLIEEFRPEVEERQDGNEQPGCKPSLLSEVLHCERFALVVIVFGLVVVLVVDVILLKRWIILDKSTNLKKIAFL